MKTQSSWSDNGTVTDPTVPSPGQSTRPPLRIYVGFTNHVRTVYPRESSTGENVTAPLDPGRGKTHGPIVTGRIPSVDSINPMVTHPGCGPESRRRPGVLLTPTSVSRLPLHTKPVVPGSYVGRLRPLGLGFPVARTDLPWVGHGPSSAPVVCPTDTRRDPKTSATVTPTVQQGVKETTFYALTESFLTPTCSGPRREKLFPPRSAWGTSNLADLGGPQTLNQGVSTMGPWLPKFRTEVEKEEYAFILTTGLQMRPVVPKV